MANRDAALFNSIFIVFLLSSSAMSDDPLQYTENCRYRVVIETSCAGGAETTDKIRVRFGDKQGKSVVSETLTSRSHDHRVIYTPKPNPKGNVNGAFSRCSIDSFTVNGQCMTAPICSLYVKRFGTDDWRPGWAQVFSTSASSFKFYFRVFTPANVWFGFDYCDGTGAFPHPSQSNLTLPSD